MRTGLSLLVVLWAACGAPAVPAAVTPEKPVWISVVGTNDVHGQLESVAIAAGYVNNLRRLRRSQGGGVVWVDAGDMFQGTLASNLGEGEAMVAAYNAAGYDAATIGNHEFDYGPVGDVDPTTVKGDALRGALLARAKEARFALLSANLRKGEGRPLNWPGVASRVLLERAGVQVGVIGVTTRETLHTTASVHVVGLSVAPLATTIAAEARALRSAGAQVVVVAAHAGGDCGRTADPADLASCEADAEIFQVARSLPRGLVDVIVAGHTHKAVAHRIHGIAIIESYANGTAFGRVDLGLRDGRVREVRIHPPQDLCHSREPNTAAACRTHAYAGASVEADPAVLQAVAPALARARAQAQAPLGVTLREPMPTNRHQETALGNLLADLTLEAQPEGDVAILNAGGIRAPLPAGPLRYGALHRTFPFDNRFALVTLSAAQLRAIVRRNLQGEGGILSISGFRTRAVCESGTLQVRLADAEGKPIEDARKLVVVTSDYLATSRGGIFREVSEADKALQAPPLMRDALAALLRQRGGELSVHDPTLASARMLLPDGRPVVCR